VGRGLTRSTGGVGRPWPGRGSHGWAVVSAHDTGVIRIGVVQHGSQEGADLCPLPPATVGGGAGQTV
jgi:hypothetical protein